MSQRSYLGLLDFNQGTHTVQQLERQSATLLPNPRKWLRAFSWTEVRDVHPARPKQVIIWGRRFEDLFYNRIGLEDDHDWSPERPLGAGGFGAVGLYSKRDEAGNIIDVGLFLDCCGIWLILGSA